MTRKLSIDDLVADLRPVAPMRGWQFALALALAWLAGLALILLWHGPRVDLGPALRSGDFWRAKGLPALALLGLGVLVLLRAVRPGRRVPALAWAGLAGVLAYQGIYAAFACLADWPAALHQVTGTAGWHCTISVLLASLPAMLATLWWLRRGAPTDPERAALAGGLLSATLGSLAFFVNCAHDHPVFVLVWYGASFAIAALTWRLGARAFLPDW